jgi:hypothetical protein
MIADYNPNYLVSYDISALREIPLVNKYRVFQIILNDMRDYAPVRTGNLRRSLHIEISTDENTLYLFVDTRYFLDKPQYYIYTNENNVRCKGWWNRLTNAYTRTLKSRIGVLEKETEPKKLSANTAKDMDLNILAALVAEKVGKRINIQEYATEKEYKKSTKEINKLKTRYHGELWYGISAILLLNIIIKRMFEEKNARKEAKAQ